MDPVLNARKLKELCVGVREPVAVAGPGFPVVCVLFACAEFHVVSVFVGR